jgi:hypothetical protein
MLPRQHLAIFGRAVVLDVVIQSIRYGDVYRLIFGFSNYEACDSEGVEANEDLGSGRLFLSVLPLWRGMLLDSTRLHSMLMLGMSRLNATT